MYEKINEYKNATLKMVDIIGTIPDYQAKVATLLDERQAILDSISTKEELIEFRTLYKQYDISVLDDKLRDLLTKELNQAKNDILEQKKKKTANFAYSKINREGFNLFSTHI